MITFGFLGWAFYEMSGGADFVPASEKLALNDSAAKQGIIMVQSESTTPAPRTSRLTAETPQNDTVTRVALNLTTLGDINDKTPAVETAVPVNAFAKADEVGVPQNISTSISSADTPAIIPSLLRPNDPANVTSVSAAQGDIRTVTGNRVNVRGGPGTDYGVVTKLTRGDAVEVLQDNGDGWVKMRPLDGGAEGWMADFLLVAG